MTGLSSSALLVILYSTLGGNCLKTCLETRPSFSNFFNLVVSVLGLSFGNNSSISVKRVGLPTRQMRMRTDHLSPSIFRALLISLKASGLSDNFFAIF